MTGYSNNGLFLADDGETILRRVGGTGPDGMMFDGYEELHPGDPEYDALLPIVRQQRTAQYQPSERQVDPDTLAMLLRATGLNAEDFKQGRQTPKQE
ncbi:hypothetical protein [Nocardia sp. NPDC056100]|uniref:hypothetical protein n=1 Tax=Nocardia sp. NPDC056100 TaxID=3345712 RepID=UPI0035D851FD